MGEITLLACKLVLTGTTQTRKGIINFLLCLQTDNQFLNISSYHLHIHITKYNTINYDYCNIVCRYQDRDKLGSKTTGSMGM